MPIRKLLKESVSWLLSTHTGRRSLMRHLSESDRFIVQHCGDHYLAFDPYDWIGENVWISGNFQRQRTEQVSELLTNSGILSQTNKLTLVEIGANIGTQTLYLMKTGAFDAVVAFEPNPRCLQLLRLNLKINHYTDSSSALGLAAGRNNQTAKLNARHFNLGASSLLPHQIGGSAADAYDVQVRRVDDVLSELDIGPSAIGLFWIDVEGFELEVLAGMGHYLSRARAVYFEYTPLSFSDQDRERLADLIFETFDSVFIHRDVEFQRITRDNFLKIDRQVDLLALNGRNAIY